VFVPRDKNRIVRRRLLKIASAGAGDKIPSPEYNLCRSTSGHCRRCNLWSKGQKTRFVKLHEITGGVVSPDDEQVRVAGGGVCRRPSPRPCKRACFVAGGIGVDGFRWLKQKTAPRRKGRWPSRRDRRTRRRVQQTADCRPFKRDDRRRGVSEVRSRGALVRDAGVKDW